MLTPPPSALSLSRALHRLIPVGLDNKKNKYNHEPNQYLTPRWQKIIPTPRRFNNDASFHASNIFPPSNYSSLLPLSLSLDNDEYFPTRIRARKILNKVATMHEVWTSMAATRSALLLQEDLRNVVHPEDIIVVCDHYRLVQNQRSKTFICQNFRIALEPHSNPHE